LVSPLNALGSAFSDGLNYLGDSMGSGLSDLWGGVTSFADDVKAWDTTLTNNFNTWFDNWLGNMKDNIQLFKDKFFDLFDYLNPLSDNFFLKLAFIPHDGYFSDYAQQWDILIHTKFAYFFQLHDTFSVLLESAKSQFVGWSGIKLDLSHYGAGEVDIVNPDAINYYSEKIKFWMGGFIYFMFAGWLIKKLAGLVGEGK